ncbi:carbohydrate ABC transporter permease [Anaerocolumna aminovalerica]|uniref:Carbohydrate ABC transporter membrane protein 2, CUT1 family n=1 Tax=Anaerocolumna aminovalerica TaxID=1527 RepID=A0A1I5F3R9_9FIRM|nr:carbohydrate ABC transporter permease [Anaerocolumna aminovalerica]MBU5332559.1 carbohydrate ABC transporter permease [Anaerocolumna aminovalerica]SFO18310.1 carbohydrate ABC transporter membrane protein 2, CUT1 family [Anaerocolumna aminovalerica]
MKRVKKISLGTTICAVIMILIALVMIVPLLNILAKSISHPDMVSKLKGYNILPKGFSMVNYQVIMNNPIVLRSIFNSLVVTVGGVAINIILTASAAYVLTRPNLVGKKLFMYFFIIMMIFEPGLVQEYLLMKDIHLLDNLLSMVLYKSVNVYYLIILMRFMEEVPISLVEAAGIDGAGHVKILFKIIIPLCKVPLLTVGMFYAVFRWNEFFKSSIFLTSKNNTVLQVLLRQFVVNSDSEVIVGAANILANNHIAQLDNGSLKAATIVVAVIPILLLYPIILKYYTSGVLSGGVKE